MVTTRNQKRQRPINFHAAHVYLRMNLYAAVKAFVLWKNLQAGAKAARPLRQRGANLLNAAMDAAWATAIVRCYVLQDRHAQAVSLERLLELATEINPLSGKQFIASADRTQIQAKIRVAIQGSKNVALLRNNELAHISRILGIPEINRIRVKARRELGPYIERCLDIFGDITLAGYGRGDPFPDFDKEIGEDLAVLLTAYSELDVARG